MTFTLISATPSPYARKVRIALLEKGLPFDLQTEVPWDKTTTTPEHNPLEKLPVLIPAKGAAIYESHFILEWLETHYPPPTYTRLFPASQDAALLAKQVQVVADGMCDACVLLVFERQRAQPSPEWTARQKRKVDGGLKALAGWVESSGRPWIVGDELSVADLAAGAVLGFLKVRLPEFEWQAQYPHLQRYSEGLEQRPSFRDTVPTPQKIVDKIV